MIAAISFVIAVVGIIFQLIDAFPEHREARRTIAIMSVGIFLGVLIASAVGAKYEISGNVDRQYALLFGLAGVACLFGGAAIVIKDEARRNAALIVAACSAAGFLLTGFAVAMGSMPNVGRNLTSNEYTLLAKQAEQTGQYERAIDRLRDLQVSLSSSDAKDAVEKHIKEVQARQASSFTSSR